MSTAGKQTCVQLTLQPNEARPFQLNAQCTLAAGSHFGLLILEDTAAEKTNLFTAYSRTQNFAASGFSIEGFPIGSFSGQIASAVGLKRTAAAPTFPTNCFIAALAEAVDYQIRLFDGTTNIQIGSDVTGSLQPFQIVRYLDIFSTAGAPAGDYQNVRAEFNDTNADPAEPAWVGFCTVQDSVSFGADFRIAKSVQAQDLSQARVMCTASTGTCSPTAALNATPWTLPSVLFKDIFGIILRHPDYVRCDILDPNAGDLEMQIREPGAINATTIRAGGNNQSSFYFYTGPRNAVNNGTTNNWFIEISAREGTLAVPPIAYGLYCASGNGVSQTRRTSSGFYVDDF